MINYAYTPRPFVVGTQATANTTPSDTLTVNGTLACSGQISGKMFLCVSKVNADGTKAVLSPSSLADFVCSVSSNVYQIACSTSHPAGANYVIQITAQGAVANVSSSPVPTATGFRVAMYSAVSAWPIGTTAPLFLTVL